VLEWRDDAASGERFAVAASLRAAGVPSVEPGDVAARVAAHPAPTPEQARRWLLPPVYERLRRGAGDFLTELRPAVALFLHFGGIDYDRDPEAGAKLDAYIRWVQSIFAGYGGWLLQLSTGDKGTYLYAAFGAPLAHEDDAKRAVAAALELRAPSFDFITGVQIGISQGGMRTGAYGAGIRRTYGVLGDEVNLAARLMQHAASGQVLVSPRVQGATGDTFLWEALAPITVKGKTKPIAVFQLLGQQRQHNLNIAAPGYRLPMIGRDAECATIADLIELAVASHGQVIGVTAEAGMGKSRLVFEMLRLAQDRRMDCYGGECQSYGTTVAYLVWRPIWYALFGIEHDAPPAERIAQLERTLTAISPELAVQMPLLSGLLDLPIEDNDITRPIPSAVRKQILEQILAQCLRGRAAMGPLCLILEDCHWIDSLSQDLLAVVSAALADVPVLIMFTYRPQELAEASRLQPAQLANFTEIRLSDLSAASSGELVEMKLLQLFADSDKPPDALIRRISEHAQGNPFYIEELMNDLRDRGFDPNDTRALAELELPGSLQSLVLSRIDRLAENQQLTVKVASIIGRRFLVAWLWGVHPILGESHDVRQDLELLQSVDLTALDTPEPELAYLFKHVITREVAYESLPLDFRRRLHEQLAVFIERTMPDAPPLDLLAYHYAHSANRVKEAHYCALASELAIRNGAYGDAHNYVRRALEIVATQPETPERAAQELGLQLSLGAILLVIRGQGALEAKAAYDRARELCRQLPPGPELGRALFGLWTYYLFQGLMRPAEELAGEALSLARLAGDPGMLIMAHLAASQTHLWTGNWTECAAQMEHVLSYYDPALHQIYITHYAQNPRFTALASGFWATWALGYPDNARAMVAEGIAEATELHHEFTYVIAYQCLPILAYLQRETDRLAATIGQFVTRAQRSGNPFYTALALAIEAWLKITQGRHAEGLAQLLQQRGTMQALGSLLVEPFMCTVVGDANLRVGQYEQGLQTLDADYATFVAHGQQSYLPEHLRIRAQLLLALGRAAEAEADFRASIEMARSHAARAFELRTAIDLGRLLAAQGRAGEARELLAGVHGWFIEGLDMPDLRDAAALLHELDSTAHA
jgi:class 3 adenylate cyclase/tetratricopeptide (TPR) repeat protein